MRFPYVMGNRNFTRPAHPQLLGPALMPIVTVTVEQPEHPLHALTTYELTHYRRRLETAIVFASTQDHAAPIRAGLEASLRDVLAEQDDRVRITHG
jgi:hypothetical protein